VLRTGGQPLVDLRLFGVLSFSSGVILAGLGIFGLFGLLFAMPQLWQAVGGVDAQGAGLRLLPVIGGMVLGALPADRLAARVGASVTVAVGLGLMAGGLAGGAASVVSGDLSAAAWMAVAGLGAGLGLSTAASTAMVELDAERSGVGAALVQAAIKLGPAFGATILGSILAASYRQQVPVAGLSPEAAATVQSSVFGGLAIAQAAGSAALAEGVKTAFAAGTADALRFAAVVAAIGIVPALLFLPRRVRAGLDKAQSEHAPATGPG
jgi:hypothetical protein